MLPSARWSWQLPGRFLISQSVGLQASCVFRGTLYHDLTQASKTLQGFFPIIASVGPCMNKPLKFRKLFHRILFRLMFLCNSRTTKLCTSQALLLHIFLFKKKKRTQVVNVCNLRQWMTCSYGEEFCILTLRRFFLSCCNFAYQRKLLYKKKIYLYCNHMSTISKSTSADDSNPIQTQW